MAELSPEKRALVGAVALSALALHNLVEKMTSGLREIDGPLNVETVLAGDMIRHGQILSRPWKNRQRCRERCRAAVACGR